MEQQIIGIKQLHTKLKTIADEALNGKSFVVVRNSKPVFSIEPIVQPKEKKYSINDLQKLQQEIGFSGGKNLSKEVDRIVYGV